MSIRRMIAKAAALAALAGCMAATGPEGGALTQIVTDPPGAVVKLEGFPGECESPCVIEHDALRTVLIARAGFNPARVEIRPGDRRVVVRLELAAPTTGVSTEILPEIE